MFTCLYFQFLDLNWQKKEKSLNPRGTLGEKNQSTLIQTSKKPHQQRTITLQSQEEDFLSSVSLYNTTVSALPWPLIIIPPCWYWSHQVRSHGWIEPPSSWCPLPLQQRAETETVPLTMSQVRHKGSVDACLTARVHLQQGCMRATSDSHPHSLSHQPWLWHGWLQPTKNQSALRYGRPSGQRLWHARVSANRQRDGDQ